MQHQWQETKSSVELIDHMGNDAAVIAAMLVSTKGDESLAELLDVAIEKGEASGSTRGRLNFLMREKHGSPWENTAMKFFVEAPIFVFREWHRHRHFSYNEASGRYMELKGRFYIPKPDRKLIQVGKPGAYEFVEGTPEQYDIVTEQLKAAYDAGWSAYQTMLEAGIAKEVARIALNLGLFSQMHTTCNARSLMHFLSLRTNEPTATFPSKPQWEIEECARMMEAEFAKLFPVTYDVFCANGRVAP